MCLGVPGKIVEIYERGVVREACLSYVPEAQVGEYTIIHVGFALNVISEEEAQETLSLLREIAELEAQPGPELEPGETQ